MTSLDQTADAPDQAMTRPFPTCGPRVQLAYRELHIAANGTTEQRRALGNPLRLPRPWDPPSCTDPELRHQVWTWLEEVVTWINSEYVWDVAGTIPACWPNHPHLVHEVAVVADQRRRAGLALTSDALEEWHRYCLPAFTDRMRARTKDHCEEGHQGWPARGRHSRHTSDQHRRDREENYTRDVEQIDSTKQAAAPVVGPSGPPRLGLVDLTTGELKDDPPEAT